MCLNGRQTDKSWCWMLLLPNLRLCQFLHLRVGMIPTLQDCCKTPKEMANICECLGGHMTHLGLRGWTYNCSLARPITDWPGHMWPMVGHPQNHRGKRRKQLGYVFPHCFQCSLPLYHCTPGSSHIRDPTGPTNSPSSHSGTCTRLLSLLLKAVVVFPALLTPAWVLHHPLQFL